MRDSATGRDRANLDYFTSSDTLSFQYAGTAISHEENINDLYGLGIESVVMGQRQDSAGARIYFAGGSDVVGWQVFSATGDGSGTWTVEPGIRISNGDLHLYPQGEGMVLLPRQGGGLRMILGSMQLSSGAANSWSIVEFGSTNGLDWSYTGDVIRAGEPGSGRERGTYSPTIVPFGYGTWRMFFTGDDLGRVASGGKSQVWSAVSFDLKNWIIEGVLIPSVDGNLYYASALGDKIAYVRIPDSGGINQIEIARVIQR